MYLWIEHITKEHFLEIYTKAWSWTFQEQSIQGEFCGTGLVPFNPGIVINKQQPVTPPDGPATAVSDSLTPTTPTTLEQTAAKLQIAATPSKTLHQVQQIA